jgi:predicted enzyme related to lactoylglutathione lyase
MIGNFKTVVFDAPDHRALAKFYVDLFDGELRFADDEWATIFTPDGWRLGFQAAPDHIQPQWPSESASQQMHLDIQVPDKDEAAKRAESLGARRIGGGATWNVMADPAGHPFCLCTNDQAEPMKVFAINIDTAAAKALAAFYGELFGMAVKYDSDEAMWIGADGGPMGDMLFQTVAGHHTPRWPDPSAPQQLHLDVLVADIAEADAKVLALGAVRLPGDGENWRVYADPSGHPFCLTW